MAEVERGFGHFQENYFRSVVECFLDHIWRRWDLGNKYPGQIQPGCRSQISLIPKTQGRSGVISAFVFSQRISLFVLAFQLAFRPRRKEALSVEASIIIAKSLLERMNRIPIPI